MPKSSRFCVKCGISEEESPLIEGLCPKCWLEENELVNVYENITIEYCKVCGSPRIHGKWLKPMDMGEAIHTALVEYLRDLKPTKQFIRDITIDSIEFLTEPSWRTNVRIWVKARVSSVELRQPYDIVVRLKPSTCPRCIMKRSGDYGVLVQIRAPKRMLSKLRSIIKNTEKYIGEDIAYDIVDVIDNENRVDVLFYSRGAANKFVTILKRIGRFREQRSFEDVGVDKHGKRRRRTIISLQLES